MNIRLAGFGGQGIVMAGYVLGRAGLLDGQNALQTQSYGSESRGGASKSDVTIQDTSIHELEAETADVVVCMSQPAFDKYGTTVASGGTLIYDSDLVQPADTPAAKALAVPATNTAKDKFASGLFANTLLLGFVAEAVGAVSPEAVRQTLLARIPTRVEENTEAFEWGRKLAREALEDKR